MICRICNKEMHGHVNGTHTKSVHNLKYTDYVSRFYKDYSSDFPHWNECEICGKIGKFKRACSRKCDSERRKLLVGEKAVRYGAILSEETKAKISKAAKGRDSKRWGMKHTKEAKKKMSEIRIKNNYSKGKNNPMYGRTHTPEAVMKIFSYRRMNMLEETVANVLDENNIEYTFQFFITENGICKSYDFKLKDKNIIIEVDGDYWHGHPRLKHKFKNYKEIQRNDKLKEEIAGRRGYKVFRFWESDIKKEKSIILNALK